MIKTFAEQVDVVPIDRCQWADCRELPSFRVGQWDIRTADEDDVTIRYMCFEHALLVQTMVDELDDG